MIAFYTMKHAETLVNLIDKYINARIDLYDVTRHGNQLPDFMNENFQKSRDRLEWCRLELMKFIDKVVIP